MPAFPPKKIFTLTPAEVEQRREQLEKYMQAGKLFMLNGLYTDGLFCISPHSGLNSNPSYNVVVFVTNQLNAFLNYSADMPNTFFTLICMRILTQGKNTHVDIVFDAVRLCSTNTVSLKFLLLHNNYKNGLLGVFWESSHTLVLLFHMKLKCFIKELMVWLQRPLGHGAKASLDATDILTHLMEIKSYLGCQTR